jgi:hypothetical protein
MSAPFDRAAIMREHGTGTGMASVSGSDGPSGAAFRRHGRRRSSGELGTSSARR